MTLALVLGALLAVACVVFVAVPFLREPDVLDDRLEEAGQEARRRLELVEERDRGLAALKELEFDHRTGKVSDQDYRALVGNLRRRAAASLASLERAFPERRNGQNSGMTGQLHPTGVDPSEPPQPATIPEPMPPPDEGTPPQPAIIPEPFPPPDEGDRPQQPNIPEPSPGGSSEADRAS